MSKPDILKKFEPHFQISTNGFKGNIPTSISIQVRQCTSLDHRTIYLVVETSSYQCNPKEIWFDDPGELKHYIRSVVEAENASVLSALDERLAEL